MYECPRCGSRLTVSPMVDAQVWCGNCDFRQSQVVFLEERLTAVEYPLMAINRLRSPEGCSVTILCPNPDPPDRGNAQAVEVWRCWSHVWRARRFEGSTLSECLYKAEQDVIKDELDDQRWR